MIDEITFLNSNWMWQLFFGAILLWIVCIWKERYQFGTARFWVRIGIAFLGIIVLVLIALKPAVPILNKKTKIVVLTNGYKNTQLDSLKKIHKKLKTLSYTVNQPIFKNVNTSDSVFVLGEGLASFDFWQLKDYKVQYLKGEISSGVIRFTYDKEKRVGEQLLFSGLYNRPKKGNQLILEGPGGNELDSIVLTANRKQSFQLSTDLKTTGNYVFSLVEKDADGIISTREPIPITVAERSSLKILIINDFPTFETKYLKNYLSEMGHQVMVKSKITKGRYKFEYFNMDRTSVGTFSIKNLAPFDLVILDAISLKNLRQKSRTALESSVKENGLGVFVQPDASFFRSVKSIVAFDFINEKNTEIELNGLSKTKISKYPFLFNDQFRLGLIHENQKGNMVSAYKHLGKGKVGATVLESTYEILLNGETKQYQQLWSKIIEDIAKKEMSVLDWGTDKKLGYIHQPYMFELRTDILEPKVGVEKGNHIAMRRDIDISNLWLGKTYPKKFGWNRIKVEQDTTVVLNYFITDVKKWKSKSSYDNILKNNNYFGNNLRKIKREQISPVKPINPIGLYIFFLVCIGYLWLVPKIEKEYY